jgi:hypothetical protein
VASTLPQDQARPVTRWTLEEIATTVGETLHTDPLSRTSIWRILHEVDLNPRSRGEVEPHDFSSGGEAS